MKRRFQRFLQTPGGKWLKAFAFSLLAFAVIIATSFVYITLCVWLAIAVGTIFGPTGSVVVGIIGFLVFLSAVTATSITI